MIASYSWLVAGEIPSQRLRSYTFGVAASAGFLGAWLITFTAPYFINPSSLNWGPRYGYIWFPSCIVSAIWVFFFLPEVKGRTLEEIDVMVSAHYNDIFRLPSQLTRFFSSTRSFQRGTSEPTSSRAKPEARPRASQASRSRSTRPKRFEVTFHKLGTNLGSYDID